jgi:hypothetical protein
MSLHGRVGAGAPTLQTIFFAALYETNDFTFEHVVTWLRDNVARV